MAMAEADRFVVQILRSLHSRSHVLRSFHHTLIRQVASTFFLLYRRQDDNATISFRIYCLKHVDIIGRSVEFQAQCLVETMRRLGVDKYSVCGVSYGGFVAFRMADMAVKEVEKLVILTAGICMTDKQKKEMVEREERDVIEILLPQKGEDLMELLRRSMYRPPRWVPAFLLRDFIEVKFNRGFRSNRYSCFLCLILI